MCAARPAPRSLWPSRSRRPSARPSRASRGRLDADQVRQRRLGRRGGTLDLRRRDHRDPLHRVHQQEEGVPHHRTAHRAPREAAEPHRRARRPGRTVRGLAPPCDLHRQPLRPRSGRADAPRTRRHRAGLRRPGRLRPRPPALGEVHRERRLVDLAATAYNLTRASGHLASAFHAKARTGTIRRHLINIPARIATGARRLTLHLPERWRWCDDFTDLWTATGQRMLT